MSVRRLVSIRYSRKRCHSGSSRSLRTDEARTDNLDSCSSVLRSLGHAIVCRLQKTSNRNAAASVSIESWHFNRDPENPERSLNKARIQRIPYFLRPET